MIRVRSWGIGGVVVDHGRPGRASLGSPRGGAVDVPSLSLANRLVGNDPAATGIETAGALVLEFDEPVMVAITGALAEGHVEHGPWPGWGSPSVLPAGSVLRIGRLVDGARAYLAVRGGLVSDGPDSVMVGPDPRTPAAISAAPRPQRSDTVRVWPGPRLDRCVAGVWHTLTTAEFVVGDTSRVGTRLRGPRLDHSTSGHLPSEGMVEDAVQVPPDGNPIVMLADHPTTGGYPVIAVVDPDDLPVVAQAAPGTALRFRPARPAQPTP